MNESLSIVDSESIVIKNMIDNNFKKSVLDFSYFLNNKYQFSISIETITVAIQNLSEINIFDKDIAREILKTILCKNVTEFNLFDDIFNDFFADKSLSSYNKYVEDLKAEEITKVKKALPSKVETLKEIKNEDSQNENFIKYENIIREKIEMLGIDEWQQSDLINICKEDTGAIREMICKYLIDNDDRYIVGKKNLEELMKKCITDKVSMDVIKFLLAVAKDVQAIYDSIKSVLDKREQQFTDQMKIIEKEMSAIHRDEFIYGKNAVKTYSNLMEENLTTLSNADMVRLSQYIRQNAYRFKTKIALNMRKSQNSRIDFKKTIKNSIKAGGVPYKIFKQKPNPSKTKIVTICDVSGSCIKSSKMLLNFLYELQSVFPGGCESFVFVSELANVTSIFKTKSIDIACNEAVTCVPRRYSDYNNSLQEFCNKYLTHVGKDTIVIFLGDARNNKNPTGEEFVEEIKKRAKKIFWLETESKEMWGEGDSAIYSYSPYISEIRELIKPKDIVDFLCGVACN